MREPQMMIAFLCHPARSGASASDLLRCGKPSLIDVAARGSPARRSAPVLILDGRYDRLDRRRRLRPAERGLAGAFTFGSSTYRSIRITGRMMIVAGP
ncbi:MAG: hypothetical protein JNM23_01080 [Bradyrhizobiaceae bacterium]|nr:hypothetical protein [Bradyrhizobiaceae bacterium]